MISSLLYALMPVLMVSATMQAMPEVPTERIQAPLLSQRELYTVQEGESLSSIAEKLYGSVEETAVLLIDNPQIKDPDVVEVGSTVYIRPKRVHMAKLLEQKQESTIPPLVQAESQASVALPQEVPAPIQVQESFQPVQSTPEPQPQPQMPAYTGGPLTSEQSTFLGNCESGMNPATNTGNGFYGAFQFSISTWNAMGTGYARADLAPLDVQIGAVQQLLSRSSIWTQFPGCAAKMSATGLL